MGSILIANTLIVAVFGVALAILRREPPRPKPALSDQELRRLAGQLGGGRSQSSPRPQNHIATGGQVSEEPAGDLPRDPNLALASPRGKFSLAPSYQRFNLISAPICLFLAFTLAAGWFALLVFLGSKRLDELRPVVAAKAPDLIWVLLILPSFFLGFVTSLLPLILLMRLVIGRRYAEYAYFDYQRITAAGRRAFRILLFCMMVVFIVVVDLCFNSYTRFDDQQIATNWFGIGERTRSYESIDKIAIVTNFVTPKGEIIGGKWLYIIFDDGDQWECSLNAHALLFGPSCRDCDELVNFLSARSGKSVTRAATIEDVMRHRTR